jgi:hypothetical protein
MQPKESKDPFHFRVSLLKSAIRFLGFIALLFKDLETAAILLMTAEIAGIVEEF